jgi:NAD(P)-dependent dehydrogenase (short-subunit alcohol dehydrogenase family)
MSTDHNSTDQLFSLEGRVAVVTGGTGLLGTRHRRVLAAAGATAVSLDLFDAGSGPTVVADITDPEQVQRSIDEIVNRYGRVDILVNNAARNPKVEEIGDAAWSRFESFELGLWDADLAVGLTGAFLVSQAVGTLMARQNAGVILNICSDLAVIAPDQRLYREDGLSEDEQPVKPVTYSIVKHGLLGLTRYLATYWADHNVRVNALSPGGVENGQSDVFISRLTKLIPLGRMARLNEYEGAVLFLCSDASSYMTGQNLVIDGGRTTW